MGESLMCKAARKQQKELDLVKQERDSLRSQLSEANQAIHDMANSYQDLRKERDQFRQDAERYRYIRDNQVWDRFDGYSVVGARFNYEDNFSAKAMLDHHIDARLRQQGKG